MPIKFADQKIREARQKIVALDRRLMELRRIVGDHRPTTEEQGRLLHERLKAFLELLELLELADTPPEEMGSG